MFFQPIAWDNAKLLLWCSFGFCGLATHPIYYFWRRSNKLRPIAVSIFILLSFTGFLELLLLQRMSVHTHQILNEEAMNMADRIRTETDSQARFLTAPDHNHYVMVRGARPILLGFTPWVLNFGFQYEPLEKDLSVMYQGGTDALALLKRHKVSYAVVGPSERFKYKPNEEFFRQNFPIAFESKSIRIYDVRKIIAVP